jgi:rhodanese-related sulfurtransferase
MRFHSINIRDIINESVATGGIMVDVRERDEFVRGHIPLAINVPVSDIQSGRCTLPKNRTLILYCESGGRSATAAKLLSEKGYVVVNTVGGIRGYKGKLTR